MSHTPSPWRFGSPLPDESPPYRRIDGGKGWYDFETNKHCGFTIAGNISEDDARLIAAAPDLLAALQEVAEMLQDKPEHEDLSTRVQAAIDKATKAPEIEGSYEPLL